MPMRQLGIRHADVCRSYLRKLTRFSNFVLWPNVRRAFRSEIFFIDVCWFSDVAMLCDDDVRPSVRQGMTLVEVIEQVPYPPPHLDFEQAESPGRLTRNYRLQRQSKAPIRMAC